MGRGGALPDRATLAAFGGVVLIGGVNIVLVRLSNRDLDPFFGAATRFLAAALLMLAYLRIKRIPLPKGPSMKGALIFGVLGFTASYAFAYWALTELPANAAGIVMASVPLLTLFFAMAHRIESFTWRGLAGALVAIAGIGVMVAGGQEEGSLSIVHLAVMVAAAASAAESGVVIKLFPPGHPFAINTVAMGFGSVLLFALSLVARETWSAPSTGESWAVMIYLATFGSIGLFTFVLFTLKRWTASAVSYAFVLFPPVTALAGYFLAGEPIGAAVIAGGVIVVAGVWMGALSGRSPSQVPPEEAPAGRPAS